MAKTHSLGKTSAHAKLKQSLVRKGNGDSTEKDEQTHVLGDELDPMNYMKVFTKDKHLTYHPRLEGKQPINYHVTEHFLNTNYKAIQ